jgi:hypothetical protein
MLHTGNKVTAIADIIHKLEVLLQRKSPGYGLPILFQALLCVAVAISWPRPCQEVPMCVLTGAPGKLQT